jgi:hypothetical protein
MRGERARVGCLVLLIVFNGCQILLTEALVRGCEVKIRSVEDYHGIPTVGWSRDEA